jgi:hypothetical protein
MKILAAVITIALLAAPSVLAAEEFALPDLTIEKAPSQGSKATGNESGTKSALTPSKSQWSPDAADKPASNFGELSGPCDGCKVGLKVEQGLARPTPGLSPFK